MEKNNPKNKARRGEIFLENNATLVTKPNSGDPNALTGFIPLSGLIE